jgi:protease IV
VAVRRAVILVLTFIGGLVLFMMVGFVLLSFALFRGPSLPAEGALVLRPGGELHETVPTDVVGQLFGREARTVRSLVESLRKAKRDPRIKSVLLIPSTLDLPYWAKVQELRDAVLDFRESGKPVVTFLEYGGDREYYLATAADRVFLLPTSPLDLTGVASYTLFLRGALDQLGAYPDFLQIGAYKTAPNQFTQSGFTPAHREMVEALTLNIYEQLVSGIAQRRGKTPDDVRAILGQGPFTPEEALRLGLVDDLVYEDEIDDRLPELRGESGEMARVEGRDYQRVSPRSAGIRPRSRIAVLYAAGTIVSGRSRYDPLNGALVGSDTMVEQIRQIRADETIRAIVLRVDSPGGSSVASDVIWRELMIARDENPSRPLVASMSDLAASGGYYIAMPSQVIVAQPATLTGSIGIYAGKIVVGGTLEKIGVTTGTVASDPNAEIYSPFTPFTPAQRERIGAFMAGFYANFVEKAAESRQRTPAEIEAVAQGRVWTGAQALDRGLVDMLGGLDTAVALAKERANIPIDEDVELVIYPPRRTFVEALAEQWRGAGAPSAWHALARAADVRALAEVSAPARLFRSGEPLALMPFTVVR